MLLPGSKCDCRGSKCDCRGAESGMEKLTVVHTADRPVPQNDKCEGFNLGTSHTKHMCHLPTRHGQKVRSLLTRSMPNLPGPMWPPLSLTLYDSMAALPRCLPIRQPRVARIWRHEIPQIPSQSMSKENRPLTRLDSQSHDRLSNDGP